MTIARRLWLGFGTLLAIFAVVVVGVVVWLHTLEQGFRQMMAVALPQTAAARDMELNSIGMGMEVMRYLDTGDPTARQRFAQDAAAFEQSQAAYDRLGASPRHKDLGRRVGVLRGEYTALGESLMAQEDAVRALYPEVVHNIDAIRNTIRTAVGSGGKNRPETGTLEADVSAVELWLARYLLTANDAYRRRLFDAAKNFQVELDKIQDSRSTAKGKQWANGLRERFTQTLSQIKDAVLLHDVQQTQTAKFGDLRKQLDGLLDNEIKLLTEEDLNAATKSTRGTVRSLQSAVSFLLLAGLLIGLSTSVVVGHAVLEAQETLRVTLKSIGDAVIATDRDGRVTLLNSVAQSLTGWTEEEAAGQPVQAVFRIISETRGAPADHPVERVLREGVVVALDNRAVLVAKDGTEKSVEDSASPIRNDRGHITGVVLIFRDVTERRHTEAEIARLLADEQHQQDSLRKVAGASLTVNSALSVDSVVAVMTEEARSIIGTNQSFGRIRRSADSGQWVAARSLSDKYAAWRTPEVNLDKEGPYKLVCESNRPFRWTQDEVEEYFAAPHRTEDPTRPPMNGWLAAPLVGRNGRNLGVIELSDKYEGEFTEADEAILTQLAHVVAPAIENAALYEELRVADRRKDEFLATLAHELRNPLAPIRNALELLQVGGDGTSEQARAMIRRQVEQMVRLVDDLIDLSRISRGKIELHKQRLALTAVIDSALETSRPLLNAADHQLTVSLPDEPLHVDADLTRLAQVFVNLLDNAAKYTPPGGRVWLTVDRQDTQVVVSVRDSGVGIPAAALPRIFDMFSQVDRSLERAPSGLGIGLSLVRRLVEMHGGSIQARSDGERQGSEFTVRLPLASALPKEEKRAPARQAKAATPVLPQRILVVDDNRDAADSLSTLLTLWGHEARIVNDGTSAVQAAVDFVPDIVLLDIGLPGLNGYEVARRLRAHPSLTNVMLVAVTGWAQPEDRRRSREAGFDHHMVKPVDLDALRELVDSFAAARSSPPTAEAYGQTI